MQSYTLLHLANAAAKYLASPFPFIFVSIYGY